MVTPMLVASQAPNPWALFGYLAIVLAATGVIARMRDWTLLMAAAFVGTGSGPSLYMTDAPGANLSAILFINAVTLAVLAFVWLGQSRRRSGTGRRLRLAVHRARLLRRALRRLRCSSTRSIAGRWAALPGAVLLVSPRGWWRSTGRRRWRCCYAAGWPRFWSISRIVTRRPSSPPMFPAASLAFDGLPVGGMPMP